MERREGKKAEIVLRCLFLSNVPESIEIHQPVLFLCENENENKNEYEYEYKNGNKIK